MYVRDTKYLNIFKNKKKTIQNRQEQNLKTLFS